MLFWHFEYDGGRDTEPNSQTYNGPILGVLSQFFSASSIVGRLPQPI
jgi:hypothetical protein